MNSVLILFLPFVAIGVCDDDFDYGNIDDLNCYHYDYNDNLENCTFDAFLQKTSTETYKNAKNKLCCGDDSFMFHYNCKEPKEIYSKLVCKAPFYRSKPYLPLKYGATCEQEKGCYRTTIDSSDFSLNQNGSIELKDLGLDVLDHCMQYQCENEWILKADACICAKESYVEREDAQMSVTLERCCPESKIGFRTNRNSTNVFECSTEIEGKIFPDNSFECSEGFLKVMKFDNQEDIGGKFCVSLEIVSGNTRTIQKSLATCVLPCNGTKPCIRHCDKDPEANPIFAPYLKKFNLNESNIFLAPPHEQTCPGSKVRFPHLDPARRCDDQFEIFVDKNDGIVINTSFSGPVPEDQFCLRYVHFSDFLVEICRENKTETKFKFYPYLLAISCIFLLITIMVYSSYKKLLNNYTRILRYYCITMFLAFIVLSMDQFRLSELNSFDCKVSGFIQYYLFLSTFTFMTIMSVEVKLLIDGQSCTSRRYYTEVGCGFIIPAIMMIFIFIVEIAAPKCSILRPRFGELRCFFADTRAKLLWFLVPIAVCLLVNFVFFIRTIVGLVQLDREKRRFNLKPNDNHDNFVLYFKLFFGMGLMWSFEIFANLSTGHLPDSAWYVSDIINMLQGFYIFVIFVCKKSVWEVVHNRNNQNLPPILKMKKLDKSDDQPTAITPLASQ